MPRILLVPRHQDQNPSRAQGQLRPIRKADDDAVECCRISDALLGNLIDSERMKAAPLSVQTHCPPRYYLCVVNARNYLLSRGYHVVPDYAGGGYAKFIWTSHWPASFYPFWTYRNQAVIWSDNSTITFQDVEPNPELGAYAWWNYPGVWWGPFVYAWHRSC